MPIDLQRMREMCHRHQWHIDDLDWSVPPRHFDRATEMAIVQYFTDMAGIELLAAALFEVQRDHAEDAVLRDIFETFIEDERRHSRVAERLAAHYDVHHYREYRLNPHLVAFRERFLEVLRHVAPDIACTYITTGELLLDIALLRSLDDFVDDEMSHAAMRKINRDESRHIAVDYHMLGYYGSDDYAARERARPVPSRVQRAQRAWAMARFLLSAKPFLRDVFFRPMDMVDPSGRRLLEAFKRIQLVGFDPGVANRPFTKFLSAMQELFDHPVLGAVFGPLVARVLGLDPRVIGKLYTEAEAARAATLDLSELAEEALAAKEGPTGLFDLDDRTAQQRGHKATWRARLEQPIARLRQPLARLRRPIRRLGRVGWRSWSQRASAASRG